MKRRIVCAAMLMKDGNIVLGVRHFSPDMRVALRRIYGDKYHLKVIEQGFVDNQGNFVGRASAFDVATGASQFHGLLKPGNYDELYSEHLY